MLGACALRFKYLGDKSGGWLGLDQPGLLTLAPYTQLVGSLAADSTPRTTSGQGPEEAQNPAKGRERRPGSCPRGCHVNGAAHNNYSSQTKAPQRCATQLR